MTQEPKIFPYIAKLLNDEKVQWKPLGEVAEIGTGNSNRQDEDELGEYPFYVRSRNILRSSSYQFDETAIIIPGEGGIGDIYHYVEGKYALHQRAYRVHLLDESILSKFLFHYMRACFKEYIISKSVGTTATSIRKPMLEKFQIPLPPLSVQQEIVRILDIFTQLEAELEAELDCRKRQYEYYRNALLSFGDLENRGGYNSLINSKIQYKTLGEVMDVYTGGEAPKNLIRGEKPEGNFIYPIYSNGEEIYGFTDSYRIKKDAVTISSIGAKTGTIYFRKAYFTPIIRLKVLVPKNEQILNSRYVFHYLSNTPIITKKSSIPNINANEVKRIQIPIPPIEEQQRIADILDKFDTLVNSISEGLPKEIQQRRQQYEYYREQLLTF